ncbi:hypothetical protein wTpre_145 [Wolbachia endosymbiont of Trichogramma pretiosum]|nr:hypothetical protein wTpre_145 [Wolbachia endosymbiont of Trichogramma pretiosum]
MHYQFYAIKPIGIKTLFKLPKFSIKLFAIGFTSILLYAEYRMCSKIS